MIDLAVGCRNDGLLAVAVSGLKALQSAGPKLNSKIVADHLRVIATHIEMAGTDVDRLAPERMSLAEVSRVLGLRKTQILKLRRFYEFPRAQRTGRNQMHFDRVEIFDWLDRQPRPADPSYVLRTSARRFGREGGASADRCRESMADD